MLYKKTFLFGKIVTDEDEEKRILKLAKEIDRHRERADILADNYRRTRNEKYLDDWYDYIKIVPRWED